MSSVYSNSLEKLKSYSFYRSPKKLFKASRSINPEFPHISKQDDVTRYNSANYNVYFYKDYPNRASTPIKTSSGMKRITYQRALSPKKVFLSTLINNTHFVSNEAKNKILENALAAQIRTDVSPPKVKIVNSGPKGSVMNDFHKRETNAGYARNGSGGFYTR